MVVRHVHTYIHTDTEYATGRTHNTTKLIEKKKKKNASESSAAGQLSRMIPPHSPSPQKGCEEGGVKLHSHR